MKKFIREFKDFAVTGNVIDLAVAVIIGTAFGKIVSSLVADVIMPPIGLLMGGINLSDRQWLLRPALGDKAAIAMNGGAFLQNVLDFLIVALVIFLMVKGITILKKQVKREEKIEEAAAPPPLTKDQELLREIRDLLRDKIK